MAVQTVPTSVNIDNVYTPWFVAVGREQISYTSPIPAITRTERAGAGGLPVRTSWNDIAFGNDIFIAVSSSTGVTGQRMAASSMDGSTWFARVMPGNASWGAIGFGNGKFVAIADASTTVATTVDGFTWEPKKLDADGYFRTITFGDNKFITLGWNSSIAQISSDGSEWYTAALPAVRNWRSLAYDSCLNRWVATAWNSSYGAYSNDGSIWSTMSMIKDASWSVASDNNGKFIAVPYQLDASGTYSTNGINWLATNTLQNARRWKTITYGENYNKIFGGRWMAMSDGDRDAWSEDGITWTSLTVTAREITSCVYAKVPWRTNDTLTINNAATVTVNTDQKKFWSAMTVTNGKLSIVNNSSTNGIRFTTGRVTGAAAQAITPASGNGTIEVVGKFIDLSIGTGLANQHLVTPYTDFISALWVETAQDSSVFDIWLNVTGAYGGTVPKFLEGLDAVGTGQRGKFFVQEPATVQDTVYGFQDASILRGSRRLLVGSTENIFPGAQVIARSNIGIRAGIVVETIVDGSTLTISDQAHLPTGRIDVSIYNPYSSQLSNVVSFGNGINGNVIPAGARVLIPNIMLTSDTPANLQTSSVQLNQSFVMTAGGNISLNTCLIDEGYHNLTQAQSINIENVGMWNQTVLTECYNISVDGLGIALSPIRRFHGTTGWIMRDLRDTFTTLFVTGTYLNNAIMNNIVAVTNTLGMVAGSITAPVGMLNFGYSSNITGTNFRLYKLQQYLAGHIGLYLSSTISNSNFTNLETYGMMPVYSVLSSNNNFTNITYSHDMFNRTQGYAAGQRIGYDPVTDEELVDNTPYYFKVRSFYTRDRQIYQDSEQFSATPFLGAKYFPDYFTCYCNAAESITFGWPVRYPSNATTIYPTYDIYRGDTPDFTRDLSSLIFRSPTTATVAFVNTVTKPSITAAANRPLMIGAANPGYISSPASIFTFLDGSILVGDKMILTGSLYNNGNYIVTAIDSSLRITLDKPTSWETAAVATLNMTFIHPTNHPTITATSSRMFVFNANKTISSSCNSAALQRTTSFIQESYVAGDVITVSGCTNPINNGIKTIASLTASAITVLEPLATEAAYTANATISGKQIDDGSTYYFVFRKYDASSLTAWQAPYSDSAPQEVYVHDPNHISVNLLLQNDVFDSASWQKARANVTANVAVSPTLLPSSITANADLIIPSAANASVGQRFPTAIDASYTFSVYIASMPYEGVKLVNGYLQLGNASTNFVVDSSFKRVSVTYKADASTTLAAIIVPTNNDRLLVSSAMANFGETADPPITTTTAAVTNVLGTRYPILMRPWCRSYGNERKNSGIEVQYHATTPTGVTWVETYCSSIHDFIPSIQNCVANITTAAYVQSIIGIYNLSSNNNYTGITQVNKAFNGSYAAYLNTGCSNNRIKNANMYLNYGVLSNLIYPVTASNDTFIHNWDVGGYRNYASIYPLYFNAAGNTAKGLTIQNLRMSNSDNPVNSPILNTIIKGMSGANASPATNAIIHSLGSVTDGFSIAYAQVYDTIFNEFYYDNSIGALNIAFTASLEDTKPYVLYNGSQFDNTGKLFLQSASDAIEYTWPHTILGVGGFRGVPRTYLQDGSISSIIDTYKLSGLDLGTTTDLLEGLKLEYNIDKGPGYTGYKRCTSANMLSETLSSSTGFGLKIKLTAVPFMKYSTKTNPFILNETIQGVTSQATAKVNEIYEVSIGSYVGTIWLTDASGSFIAGELVRAFSDASTRATNVATNTFPLGPSFTSYINGLQFYTYVDTSVLYPSEIITLSMVVKDELNVPIEGAFAFIDDAAVTAPYIMNTVTDVNGIASVSYSGGPSSGSKWRVRKYGYKPYNQSVDIASANVALPITLIRDPQQV